MNQPTNQPIDWMMNQMTNQPTDKLTNVEKKNGETETEIHIWKEIIKTQKMVRCSHELKRTNYAYCQQNKKKHK